MQAGVTAAGLRWAATAVVGANWHPLTLLSHMVDCQLFGLNPRGHHLTSVMLHLAAVLLLWAIFQLLHHRAYPFLCRSWLKFALSRGRR